MGRVQAYAHRSSPAVVELLEGIPSGLEVERADAAHLGLHGIGSPHRGVTDDDERFYWVRRQAFTSLLQTIAVTREGSNLPVAITFDDGNESDALIALPELAKGNAI